MISRENTVAGFDAEKLDRLLTESKISSAVFSRALCCHSRTVRKWRSGEQRPGMESREKICKALNLPQGYFDIQADEENIGTVIINSVEIPIVEHEGRRVVTFKDIDRVHNRVDGTARKRFNDNRGRFIEGEDFFKICASTFRSYKGARISNKAREDITLITESGYLMIVKSFHDDLAWEVQRQLVCNYFKIRDGGGCYTIPGEAVRPLTTTDYIDMAKAVGQCSEKGLPIIVYLLRMAGVDIPEEPLPLKKKENSTPYWKNTKKRDMEGRAARMIEEAITSYGMTARSIGRLVGLQATQILRIRTGESKPSLERAEEICSAIEKEIEKAAQH